MVIPHAGAHGMPPRLCPSRQQNITLHSFSLTYTCDFLDITQFFRYASHTHNTHPLSSARRGGIRSRFSTCQDIVGGFALPDWTHINFRCTSSFPPSILKPLSHLPPSKPAVPYRSYATEAYHRGKWSFQPLETTHPAIILFILYHTHYPQLNP